MARDDITIVIIGAAKCGKTSLVNRACLSQFSPTYAPTVGADFRVQTLSVKGREVKVQIWDTAGQERLQSEVESYYSDASAFILVVDVTEETAALSVPSQMAKLQSLAAKDTPVLIFANKCESMERKVTPSDIANAVPPENEYSYSEGSAKTGEKVNEAFRQVAELASKRSNGSSNRSCGCIVL